MTQFIRFIFTFIFVFSSFLSHALENDGSRYAPNSVLSQGTWYKIKVPATGMYKLTYDDLKKIGLTNPQNVKIYGYGGGVLNEDFRTTYIDDLPQVSIWMSKSLSNFGKGDYILFYAQGNIRWSYDEKLKEFVQEQDPYSFDSYYFVTESTDATRLAETQKSLSGSTVTYSTFDDYYLYEEELKNVGQTGREFYGEDFTAKKNRDFKLPLDGVTASPAVIRYEFISKAPLSSGKLEVSLNGTLEKTNFTAVNNDYYTFGTEINDIIVKNDLKNNNTLNLNYTRGATLDMNVHLNYIRVNYNRELKPYGAVTLFRNKNLADNIKFQVKSANSSMLVFDVTENTTIKKIDTELSGSLLSFAASNNTIREYALVDVSKDIPKPTLVGKVNNQNLHALKVADMVIIVQPFLQKYAEQLAKIHEEDSGLKSLIVNPEDIYNEFSSGKPDVTAYRRFMKMFYDRASSEEEKPQYLLLFGGGTFDNRFIGKEWTETDKKTMLLTYQSKFSLVETASYVTDDYIGFLDDSEGSDPSSAKMDISIGRLPVCTENEAKIAIDKIQKYIANANIGIWENTITFVADDAVAGENSVQIEKTHMSKSDAMADIVSTEYPDFIVNKIYEDSFERKNDAFGATYPDATKVLLDKITSGTLVLNYVGHGSTKSWTHEKLLTIDQIKAMNNDRLPLWITATCDFSRFDDGATSGGIEALFNSNGGAIALYSTVRVVYMSSNKVMNDNIIKHIFEKENGKPARLGDIMRHAKTEDNLLGDLNKLKFFLLGDPALRLAYPEDKYKIELLEINDIDADAEDINIQALDNMVIKGQIVDQNGDVVTGFNGTLESVVFDALQTLKTRGNTASGTNENVAQEYTDYTNSLFSGKTEIKDGMFEIHFVTPKDILELKTKGKMSFLAYDVEKKNRAQGSFNNYTIGGTNPNAKPENNPPVVSKLYLNTEDFQSGDVVNSTPILYAEVSDDTGINLSSSTEHNISLVLNGEEEFDLTPYFQSEDNSSKKGTIKFPFSVLPEGKHSLEFKVWDVWVNYTMVPLEFTVAGNNTTTVDKFVIWGNPARDMTRFVFDASDPGQDVNIKIYVYSITGQLVWMHEERGAADSLSRYIYEWDLNGNGGGRLNPGVYICTAYVTVDGKSSFKKSQKLIISNNN